MNPTPRRTSLRVALCALLICSAVLATHRAGAATQTLLPFQTHLWRYLDYGRQVRLQIMLAVTDFTAENGATQVVPGSHTWSEERVADPSEAVSAVMRAGSALLFLGSTHHGGGANKI